jgi:ABC-type transport system substrate-binding protein
VTRVALPERPSEVVFDRRSAWALLPHAQRVAQIDLKTHRRTGDLGLPFQAGGLAVAGGSLFATESRGAGVVRIDARRRRVTARWSVAAHGFRTSDPTGIAAGAASVWLARGAEVVRVDARSGRTMHRFELPVTATLLAFAHGRLWAASSENGLVEEIDPATNRIAARARLHGWVSALTIGGGSVWASVVPDDVVFRLSEDDASIEATRQAGRDPAALSTAPGVLWIANAAGSALTRVDMGTGGRSEIPLDGTPQLVRQHAGLLWIAATPLVPPPSTDARGPEIRVALPDSQIFVDPAGGVPPSTAQLLYATGAKLLTYPDAPGAAGRQLGPDAAAALPSLSADHRTYTFRIRDGMRFSPPSGRLLDARTFKSTLERTLSPKLGHDPAGLHILGDVVGARAFQAGRARSVAGIVARGQMLSITLLRPAGDLPARLAMPLFGSVPIGTPLGANGPIASAGPYYVRTQTADQTVLERNPGYHGERPRGPARIVYLTGVPAAKAVALADGGRVDLVPWDYDLHGPLVPGGTLARRFGAGGSGRYRAPPAPGVDMIAFNTRRPLFRDPRLRRAVSYALDRRALAAVFDEQATDRYVPPAVPGASATHVYPVAGPDLATARRLARSGTRKRRARLYFCGEPANLRVAQLVRSNLRRLGIAVTIDQSLGCLRGPDPKAARADLLLATRSTLELDPAPFLRALAGDTSAFGSGLGPVTWSDRGFRTRLRRADALDGPERLAAFARLEDEVLRGAAPSAAYGAFVAPEYFSARTGCKLLQGAYNFADLGALCVRGG